MQTFLIDPQEWPDVASDVGTGVYYWARELTDDECAALESLHLPREGHDGYTVAFMAIDPDTGNDDRLVLVRRREYEAALGRVVQDFSSYRAANDILQAFRDRAAGTGYIETTHLDAETHDVAVQVHAFGEVRYG